MIRPQNPAQDGTGPQELIDFRLAALERGLEANTAVLRDVSLALNRLAVLEEKHLETREAQGRAFARIEDHERRLQAIEVALPQLKEIRAWVVRGILAGLGMIGLGVAKLVLIP